MLEPIKEGLLGLVLVFGHWLSPGTEKASLEVEHVDTTGSAYVIECAMDVAWNPQLGELVDAGIPLRFRITATPDVGDTVRFLRVLRFDIADNHYTYADSSLRNYADTVFVSRPYPQVLLALRDFSRWRVPVSKRCNECRLEARLLRSRVSQLNRKVDMTEVWGQRSVGTVVVMQE
jgi:hypothetical protein